MLTANDIIKIIRDFSDELREDFITHEVKDYPNASWPEILEDTKRGARWTAILELQNRISEVWLNEVENKTEVNKNGES